MTLTYDDVLGYWASPNVATCSVGGIRFACTQTAPNDWAMAFDVGNAGGPEDSCAPFLVLLTGTNFGPCAGAFSVAVSE